MQHRREMSGRHALDAARACSDGRQIQLLAWSSLLFTLCEKQATQARSRPVGASYLDCRSGELDAANLKLT